jgi:hypothetical protein
MISAEQELKVYVFRASISASHSQSFGSILKETRKVNTESIRNGFARHISKSPIFYVLLTVHLGIILVNDQLDAQFFFLICLFQSSSFFEQPRAHHQENQFYQYSFWYKSLCVSGRLVCRSGRNTYTE